MGALLEIAAAFLVMLSGFSGLLNNYNMAQTDAYINNDTTRMQQAVDQIKQYCIQNVNGTPCTITAGSPLASGSIPQTLTGYWQFYAPEEMTGQQFAMNLTAGTSCVSIDDPAAFTGQNLPASIPVLSSAGVLITKSATATYYLHADETYHGVYATASATSTPGAC
jgi:hypothetical protein